MSAELQAENDRLKAQVKNLLLDVAELRRQIIILQDGLIPGGRQLEQMRKFPNGFGLTYSDVMDLIWANAALRRQFYKVT